MTAPMMLLLTVLLCVPQAANANDLIKLLTTRSCPDCKLTNEDLVHADLREADLSGAHLQRANLSQARLEGANLRGSDLSFTNLRGASLRGSDLRGSRLTGTDLRETDLTDAKLDIHALEQSHWARAKGVVKGARSHAGLHNAGVREALAGRWIEAEQLFNAAIETDPDEPLSWVARGLSRDKQGKVDLASGDFTFAGDLFARQGDLISANLLQEASRSIYHDKSRSDNPSGNGASSALVSGTISTLKVLTQIAIKSLIPMIP